MSKKSSPDSAVVKVPSRDISEKTKLILYVIAGGWCEFEGCDNYLIKHPLTHDPGNFAQMAHIVAFKEEGPRGKSANRPKDINALENLMLLCQPCHHLVDKERPQDYPREKLEAFKRKHEERIYWQTKVREDYKTTVVQLKSLINGQMVDIPVSNVKAAVAPRYVSDPRGYIIDLTGIEGSDESFYRSARATIKSKVARLYDAGMEVEQTQHISLFALAPIPLLVYLGNRLSNKVAVDAYQRHRDTEDWLWKSSGETVGHIFRTVRAGSDANKVALLMSLSGSLSLEKLPPEIDNGFYVYEITLAKGTPSPTYLRLKEDLNNFREVYQHSLRFIEKEHHSLKEIHLFPAVPAPVAVHCGRELLPKVDPVLRVYDNDKKKGGFKFVFAVNDE